MRASPAPRPGFSHDPSILDRSLKCFLQALDRKRAIGGGSPVEIQVRLVSAEAAVTPGYVNRSSGSLRLRKYNGGLLYLRNLDELRI